MGRSRYRIYENRSPHFLTCTIINWIPVFTRPDTAQIILDSLAFLHIGNADQLQAAIRTEDRRATCPAAETRKGEAIVDDPEVVVSAHEFPVELSERFAHENQSINRPERGPKPGSLPGGLAESRTGLDAVNGDDGRYPELLPCPGQYRGRGFAMPVKDVDGSLTKD